jgi:type IV fimbrial biogenesis protein FimT
VLEKIMKLFPRQRLGFTLVEMMITIGILGLLTALALPSFVNTIRRNAVVNEANRLVISMQNARARALSGSPSAGVCVSDTSSTCSGGTPGQWERGYAIFFTPPNSSVRQTQEFLAMIDDGKVRVRASTLALAEIEFNRLGRLANVAAGGVQFVVCWEGNSSLDVPGMNVFVSASGRVSQFKMNNPLVIPCTPNSPQF